MNGVTSAGGLIAQNGKLLLIRLESGKYAVPKGHIEDGETTEQAAIREVQEETGVIAEIQAYLGNLTRQARENSGEVVSKTIELYLMKQTGLSSQPLDEESEWVDIKRALESMHFAEEADFLKQHIHRFV